MCSIGLAGSTDIESASLEKRKTSSESGRVPEPLERRVMRKSARWPHTSFRTAPPSGGGENGWRPVRLREAIIEADGGAGQLEEGKGGRHVTSPATSATPPPRQFFSWSRQDSDWVLGADGWSRC